MSCLRTSSERHGLACISWQVSIDFVWFFRKQIGEMIPDSKRHAGPIHRIQSTIIPSLQSYQGPVMILSILSFRFASEIQHAAWTSGRRLGRPEWCCCPGHLRLWGARLHAATNLLGPLVTVNTTDSTCQNHFNTFHATASNEFHRCFAVHLGFDSLTVQQIHTNTSSSFTEDRFFW